MCLPRVSIPSLAGQTARLSKFGVRPIGFVGVSFNPLISGADRAMRLIRPAPAHGPHVSIPSLAGQTARPNSWKPRYGPISTVSIPSLAGQTARRHAAFIEGIAKNGNVSIPSLAGQTARRNEVSADHKNARTVGFNPLISGADRATACQHSPTRPCKHVVSIPSLAGQTARRYKSDKHGIFPLPSFNPLISGADRATRTRIRAWPYRPLVRFQSPH